MQDGQSDGDDDDGVAQRKLEALFDLLEYWTVNFRATDDVETGFRKLEEVIQEIREKANAGKDAIK